MRNYLFLVLEITTKKRKPFKLGVSFVTSVTGFP